MEKYDIEIYSTNRGKEPFSIWLKSLEDRMKNSVLLRLQRMREGDFGDCKSLQRGLYELRIHREQGLIIYFTKIGSKILLLLGGRSKQ